MTQVDHTPSSDKKAGRPDTVNRMVEPTAFQRLRHLLAPDRSEIIIVIGFAVGLGFLTLATPIAVQTIVNFVAFGGLMQWIASQAFM